MDPTLLIGLAVIIFAYGVTWFLVIKCNRIIEKINQKKLKSTRQIEKELEL